MGLLGHIVVLFLVAFFFFFFKESLRDIAGLVLDHDSKLAMSLRYV